MGQGHPLAAAGRAAQPGMGNGQGMGDAHPHRGEGTPAINCRDFPRTPRPFRSCWAPLHLQRQGGTDGSTPRLPTSKAGMGTSRRRTPSAASPAPLASWPPGIAPQKKHLGCGGGALTASRDHQVPRSSLHALRGQATSLPPAREKVESERRVWQGFGGHFSTQQLSKLSSGKEGVPVRSSSAFPLPFPQPAGTCHFGMHRTPAAAVRRASCALGQCSPHTTVSPWRGWCVFHPMVCRRVFHPFTSGLSGHS